MRTIKWALFLSLALTVSAGLAEAQRTDPQNEPVKPVAPAGSTTSAKETTEPAPTAQDLTPDTRPLTGVQVFTLGRHAQARNYVRPRLQVSQIVDNRSDPFLLDQVWRTATSVQGGISFQRVWRNYEFVAGYSGGGTFYPGVSGLNEHFHTFGFAQSFNWRRWNILIADDFGYLPESNYFLGSGQFGWLAGTGLMVSGPVASPQLGLSPSLSPNQSIITGRAARFTNVAVAQAQYKFSVRSSITASGSYALLKFREPGFVNSTNAVFRAGYDRTISARDTVGIIYQASLYRFDQGSSFNNFDAHTPQVTFGRRLTGRLAWTVSGGPQFVRFANPSGTGDSSSISFAASTTLQYSLRRTGLGLSYSRGASGGAGVFSGSNSDSVGFSVTRQFSRKWTGGGSFSYARNSALRPAVDPVGSTTFNTLTWGGDLNYSITRNTRLFFNYNGDRQTNTIGGANLPYRHRFGVGIDFGVRPIALE